MLVFKIKNLITEILKLIFYTTIMLWIDHESLSTSG